MDMGRNASSIINSRVYVRCCRPVLVRCGSDGANPHVFDPGVQGKAECAEVSYVPRDYQGEVWDCGAFGVHAVCVCDEYFGGESVVVGWKCSCYEFDRHASLRCRLSDTSWFVLNPPSSHQTLKRLGILTSSGVCAYVILGGLRATFLCDYSHTLILMIIILYFMFNAYAVSPLIGSPGEMYELLKKAGTQRPIAGNKDGSYLTLKSNYGLIFGVIQLCSGSGTVFLDQAYWQRAIASKPSTAVRAYLLGGLAWFAIPFGFSTTLGLAAAALTDNPRFPTYPNPPTSGQISSGLAAAFAAETLLGQGGAVALLIVLFMAVTSCASAELIAVSSLLTFDVYKAYVQPKATPKQLIFVSHIMICVFGLTMSVFACIWNAASIDLGWLFLYVYFLVSMSDGSLTSAKSHGPPYRRRRLSRSVRHNMAQTIPRRRHRRLSLRPCSWSHRLACNRQTPLRRHHCRVYRRQLSHSSRQLGVHHDRSHRYNCDNVYQTR